MPNFTPILPAAARDPQVPLQQDFNAGNDSSSTPGPRPPRKHISVACQQCQLQRIKCSGQQPCKSCEEHRVECIYKTSTDARRKESRKRKVDNLQADSDLLYDIIETIRDSHDYQVGQLVALIRSNASAEELKRCAKQQIMDARLSQRERSPEVVHLHGQIEQFQNDTVEHLSSRLSQNRSDSGVFKIDRLIDEPPYRVPAYPWTTVTTDDNIVSNIVSLWINWSKPLYNWVDQDLFLRDMRKGDLNSEFCSPFMVNALLASHCFLSDYHEVKTESGVESGMVAEFREEARRLLDADDDVPTLPKAQGLCFLVIADASCGRDGMFANYFRRAGSMAQKLYEALPAMEEVAIPTQATCDLRRAVQTTYWGVFNISVALSLSLRLSPPDVSMPLNDKPKKDSSTDSIDDFTVYPYSGAARSSFSSELQCYMCDLALIGVDLCSLYRSLDTEERYELSDECKSRVHTLAERIDRWGELRPAYLAPKDGSAASLLDHYAFQQGMILGVFGCSNSDYAKTRRRDAALEIARLTRLHRSMFGNKIINAYWTQPLTQALHALLDEEDISKYSVQVTDLCVCFRALARRLPIALGVLRLFQLTAKNLAIQLPPATDKLFEDFEKHDWQGRDLHELSVRFQRLFVEKVGGNQREQDEEKEEEKDTEE